MKPCVCAHHVLWVVPHVWRVHAYVSPPVSGCLWVVSTMLRHLSQA